MKKAKRYFLHFVEMGMALGMMALLSLLSPDLLNTIGVISLVTALILFALMCVIYVKKGRATVCLLAIMMFSFSAMARSLEDCDAFDAASVEEGNFCRYNVLEDTFGSDVCKYMKTFNPSKVKTGDAQTKMQLQVNNADKIVQAYNELDDAHQNALSGSCKVLTPEDRNKSQSDRLKILSDNNTPLCCAWALQSKFQMYTAQNGERQVETVPMMLSRSEMQCWPCDVVFLLITLANTMAYRSAPSMAAVGLFFLKWMFIFWIILKIGCLFLNRNYNGKPYMLGDFLKELFARTCWASLAALVIAGTAAQLNDKTVTNKSSIYAARDATLLDQAYARIINPPFEIIAATGIEMAQALIRGENSFYGKVAQAVDKQSDANVRVYGSAMKKTDYCSVGGKITESPIYQQITLGGKASSYKLDVASQGRAISNDTARNLLCLTQLSFQGLAPISAAGSIITTHAIKNSWSLPFPLPGFMPVMPQLFYGLLLMIVCWLLGVAVGFRLIDIMVRVCVVIMLCPIFIVAAVFPITRDKAKTAVVFFVSAVMGFIEIAIAVGMIVPCFYHAIASNGNEKDLIDAMVAPSSPDYVPNLYAQFSDGGMRFFLFITVVGWMGFKMLEAVSAFFENIFQLRNVGKIGAGQDGSMMGAANSIRNEIGERTDQVKNFSKDTGLGKKLKKSKLGRGLSSIKSAGNRVYNKAKAKIGTATDKLGTALGSGSQAAGRRMMQTGGPLKKALGAGLAGFGAASKAVGNAGRALSNGMIGRNVKRAGKAMGGFAKEQAKMALYDFFHPKASSEERDAYKRSLKNKK